MTAAERSAALLRQLDEGRSARAKPLMVGSARIPCTEPECRSELLCDPRHVDNLTPWRCLTHRPDERTTPSTTNPRKKD